MQKKTKYIKYRKVKFEFPDNNIGKKLAGKIRTQEKYAQVKNFIFTLVCASIFAKVEEETIDWARISAETTIVVPLGIDVPPLDVLSRYWHVNEKEIAFQYWSERQGSKYRKKKAYEFWLSKHCYLGYKILLNGEYPVFQEYVTSEIKTEAQKDEEEKLTNLIFGSSNKNGEPQKKNAAPIDRNGKTKKENEEPKNITEPQKNKVEPQPNPDLASLKGMFH